jgi:hypothetical protein
MILWLPFNRDVGEFAIRVFVQRLDIWIPMILVSILLGLAFSIVYRLKSKSVTNNHFSNMVAIRICAIFLTLSPLCAISLFYWKNHFIPDWITENWDSFLRQSHIKAFSDSCSIELYASCYRSTFEWFIALILMIAAAVLMLGFRERLSQYFIEKFNPVSSTYRYRNERRRMATWVQMLLDQMNVSLLFTPHMTSLAYCEKRGGQKENVLILSKSLNAIVNHVIPGDKQAETNIFNRAAHLRSFVLCHELAHLINGDPELSKYYLPSVDFAQKLWIYGLRSMGLFSILMVFFIPFQQLILGFRQFLQSQRTQIWSDFLEIFPDIGFYIFWLGGDASLLFTALFVLPIFYFATHLIIAKYHRNREFLADLCAYKMIRKNEHLTASEQAMLIDDIERFLIAISQIPVSTEKGVFEQLSGRIEKAIESLFQAFPEKRARRSRQYLFRNLRRRFAPHPTSAERAKALRKLISE